MRWKGWKYSTYVSGTAVKISSSSRWSSSSVLGFASSSGVCCGSHEATSRWLRDRATLARLRITSDSLLESDILVSLCSMSQCRVIGGFESVFAVGICGVFFFLPIWRRR